MSVVLARLILLAHWVFATLTLIAAVRVLPIVRKKPTIVAIAVLYGCLLICFEWWASSQSAALSGDNKEHPELVLIAPTNDLYYFSWVPSLNLSPSILLAAKSSLPTFELRNLSSKPVVAINLDWVVPGPSAESVFLSHRHFVKYGPRKQGDMIGFDHGPSMLAADNLTTTIPYIGNSPVGLRIPGTIWNSFKLKFIASQQRIDPKSERARALPMATSAVVINLGIRYRQGQNIYEREFEIIAETRAMADGVYTNALVPPSVPYEHWSEDNLRSTIRFLSRQR